MASPNPGRQGAREVYGSVGIETPNGDSAMDDTNDAVRVNVIATVGGGGGGTEYDEDAASVGGEKLTLAGSIRQDTPAGSTSADGDYANLKTDSVGRLWVNASGAAVPVTDNGGALTVDGTVTANLSATDNAVLDQIDANTDFGVVVGAGVEATALRVTIASDSTGLLSIDDNGGSLTVDNPILSVVGGGTEATAQRVTIASDSTGVLSVDDNGGSLTVDNAALSVVGGGTEATAQRVTIASDSTGVLSVDDNGGSITVDGTVTANAGTGVFDVTPASPAANDYLPVRLTDGSAFYSASGGGSSDTATFWVLTGNLTFTANRFQLVVYNNNASALVKIRLLIMMPVSAAAVTPVATSIWTLRRRTGPTTDPTGTGGLTVLSMDTDDALPSSITAFSTPGTAPAGGTTQDFSAFLPPGEELKPIGGATLLDPTTQGQIAHRFMGFSLYDASALPGCKPLTLRQDQTFEVQQSATAGTATVYRLLCIFTAA